MESNTTSNDTFSTCVLPYDITEEQWSFYYAFLWWTEGFGSILIGCVGIFFNLITILVLLGSELAANFFNWLLVCLAMFDSSFLLNGILEAFRNHIGSTNVHVYMFVVFLYPFRSIVMCCSIYTTVMLALERYNALARPMSHQGICLRTGNQTLKHYFHQNYVRIIKYIGPIIILATIFNIPKWLELEVATRDDCVKYGTNTTWNQHGTNTTCSYKYTIALTGLRSNNHYNLWYQNIFNLLITGVTPLISLTYLNVNIYLKFKQYLQRQPLANAKISSLSSDNHAQQKMKKREKDMIQQTMILFSVVILFGLCHILRIILNIEEFSSLDDRKMAKEQRCQWLQYWTIIASPVSHLLLQINSSINF